MVSSTRCRSARLFAAALVIFAGCTAAIDPKAFDAFSTASRTVRQAADRSLSAVYDLSRDEFLRGGAEHVSDPTLSPALTLKLDPAPPDPFGWKTGTGSPVVPWSLAETRAVLDRLNAALVGYAGLLRDLVGTKESEEKFEELAKKLNDNVVKAAQVGKVNELQGDNAKILSAVAIGLGREYVQRQRSKKLEELIIANQPTVQTVCGAAANGVAGVARALRQTYLTRSATLSQALLKAPPARARSGLEELMQLDEDYVATLDVLRGLHEAYELFPLAHAKLADAVSHPESANERIRSLIDVGQRINGIYEDLGKREKEEKKKSESAPKPKGSK